MRNARRHLAGIGRVASDPAYGPLSSTQCVLKNADVGVILDLEAHRGVMFPAAPFQCGAIQLAEAHGMALVEATEGRFTLCARQNRRLETNTLPPA